MINIEEFKGFCCDSRLADEGFLFFAILGERVDGHDFLSDVAKNGAKAAVVSNEYKGENFGLKLYFVEDVLAFLQRLATEVREKSRSKVVAITGSVGKTTTKEFLYTLLKNKFDVAKSHSSYNSQITLPLSILNAKRDANILILEMAMSEKGQIEKLVNIAKPEFVLITKIALAHSEFFTDGLKGIASAKAEILSSKRLQYGLLNHELKDYPEILSSYEEKIEFFSTIEKEADYFLEAKDKEVKLFEKGKEKKFFSLPFLETHLLEDFLAAAALAKKLGMTWEEIAKEAKNLKPYKMRFEKINLDGVVVVNDAYNANPESMKMAFENLPKPKNNGKTIAVLGDMKELGKISKSAHKQIAKLAYEKVDCLLCLGPEAVIMYELFKQKNKSAHHFQDHKSLALHLTKIMQKEDVILLKGSRSMEMEKVLSFL